MVCARAPFSCPSKDGIYDHRPPSYHHLIQQSLFGQHVVHFSAPPLLLAALSISRAGEAWCRWPRAQGNAAGSHSPPPDQIISCRHMRFIGRLCVQRSPCRQFTFSFLRCSHRTYHRNNSFQPRSSHGNEKKNDDGNGMILVLTNSKRRRGRGWRQER